MPTVTKVRVRPYGLRWRSSAWFVTLVVGMGITTDFLIYSIIIPVMPFHLQALGYSEVSALMGYLLFAYSSGLAISTPVIAWYCERLRSRKGTLMIGLLALSGSQILLMESQEYWVMIIARVLQGISAAAVWTAGLALVCDTVSEEQIGRYLGLAMSGLPLGQLIGPPVGGVLYDRFGIRGPCVFAIIVISVDLIGRNLVIERKEALTWGFDPASSIDAPLGQPDPQYGTFASETDSTGESGWQVSRASLVEEPNSVNSLLDQENTRHEVQMHQTQHDPIAIFQVIGGLCRSSRAVAAVTNSLVCGILYSVQEPSLPIHLQRTWNLNSSQVGLVFVGAALPAMLAPPIAGWLTDHIGPEWVSFICLLAAIPCWIAVTVRTKLSLFVVAFALESRPSPVQWCDQLTDQPLVSLDLCTSAFVAPVTTELALVSRRIPGVGYAHVYGAFNVAVGIGASVGTVLSGEIFQRSSKGWTILNLVVVAIIIAASAVVALFTGERPLARRLREYRLVLK
ncbi:major facilitator superfamily domain-containing protein [Russula dissimulans]|nr:major facilitator superfamily domain-containing protein [Russula dissimulans]